MATKFPKIKIVYCAECGYEDICLNVVGRLMREFDMRLDSITILPAAGGQLEISVDDELIHSTLRTGKFPREDELVAQISQRLQ